MDPGIHLENGAQRPAKARCGHCGTVLILKAGCSVPLTPLRTVRDGFESQSGTQCAVECGAQTIGSVYYKSGLVNIFAGRDPQQAILQ